MRIQPLEIDVPEDDPFKNDLLGREETVKVLTHIVRSIEGPCVLSVDAAWGAGKTTFLNIWAQHLRNEGFPVVGFNAWETDFSEEPFIALSTELTVGLNQECEKCADDSLKESLKKKVNDVKGKAKEVARSLIPGIIKAAAAGIPLVGGELGQALASLAEEKLNAYEKARMSVKDFNRTLGEMAKSLSKSRKDRPLVMVIDELDRCRPSYAVELLEVAKHIFAVEHVVFVLGVNRSQLAHSVKALYGVEFDALDYLGRFFDLDFRLPEPDRSAFVDSMMKETRINHYLIERCKGIAASERDEIGGSQELLHDFLGKIDLSLREIGQAIHRLGLVFTSLPRDQLLFSGMMTVMFLLRTSDTDLYYRFIDGEVSDLEVVDAVFNRPGIKTLRHTPGGQFFELMIIVAAEERQSELNQSEQIFENSRLLERYRADSIGVESSDQQHAKIMIAKINAFSPGHTGYRGFKQAVERIELLSTVLIEPEPSPLKYNASLSKATGSVNTQAYPKEPS